MPSGVSRKPWAVSGNIRSPFTAHRLPSERMRALFLLLVLANLMFFVYAQVAREGADAGSRISRLQITPEKIKQLKAMMPGGKAKVSGKAISPVPPKAAAAVPTACLEWGVFAGPAVAKAESALASLELPASQIERSVADAGGYWVYMPPLKTKVEIDRKIAELKKFGISEFFVVQDAGQWKNAISLGIFRTEDAAQVYLAKLKERGVRSAIAARRENFLKQVAFHVREPTPATVATLTELQKEFPGTEMKAGPCPSATVAAKG